jgi:opacity protein-like surface antigen
MVGAKILIGVAAMVSASAAAAQTTAVDDGMRVTAAVTGGTLGIGPEVGLRFSDTIGIRGNATFLGFGADFDSDDITYDGKLKLKSFGAMVDLYPFGGSFRVSGGARINHNRARVRATPTGTTVEVGDDTYTAAQIGTLTGRADVRKFAPALTLGWGGGRAKGFMFGTEAGVLFQGRARLRQFTATGTLANNQAFRNSLERERLDLQDDIDKVKVYPILQVMIGWRF